MRAPDPKRDHPLAPPRCPHPAAPPCADPGPPGAHAGGIAAARTPGGGRGPALTRGDAGVLQLAAVVGAASLLQPGVGRGAAVAQRAGAAADGGVQRVEVLRALEALVVVALHVHPAVAVFSGLLGARRAPAQPAQEQPERQQRPHRRWAPGAAGRGRSWRAKGRAPRCRLPRGAARAAGPGGRGPPLAWASRGRGGGRGRAAGSAGRGSAWCAGARGRGPAGSAGRGCCWGCCCRPLPVSYCCGSEGRADPSAASHPTPQGSHRVPGWRPPRRTAPLLVAVAGSERSPKEEEVEIPTRGRPGPAAPPPPPLSVTGAGVSLAAAKYKRPRGC